MGFGGARINDASADGLLELTPKRRVTACAALIPHVSLSQIATSEMVETLSNAIDWNKMRT